MAMANLAMAVGSTRTCPVFVAHQLSASVCVFFCLWGLWSTPLGVVHKPTSLDLPGRSGSRGRPRIPLSDELAGGVIACQQPGTMEHGERPVRILAHLDTGLDVVGSYPALRKLKPSPGIRDRIVASHDPLLLDTEDLPKQRRVGDNERAFAERRRLEETRIMPRQVDVANISVGVVDPADPGKLQLLRQPVLQGAEHALRSAPRLGK